MKAEHRKELQTNVLADRMGRMIQTIKQRPQRRTVLWVILALIVVGAAFYFFRSRHIVADKTSKEWTTFLLGDREQLAKFANRKEGNIARASYFHFAWLRLWDGGIKNLAADPENALRNLAAAEQMYEQAAKETKDDPTWHSEALYALAIIEETRAVRDRKHLDSALAKYDDLAKTHGDTAFGKLAKERADTIKANKADIVNFYGRLQDQLKIKAPPEFPREFLK